MKTKGRGVTMSFPLLDIIDIMGQKDAYINNSYVKIVKFDYYNRWQYSSEKGQVD